MFQNRNKFSAVSYMLNQLAGMYTFANWKMDNNASMSVNMTLQKIYFCSETLGGANMLQFHGSHFSKEMILSRTLLPITLVEVSSRQRPVFYGSLKIEGGKKSGTG